MKPTWESTNSDIENRVQQVVRKIKKGSSVEDKANASLALAILALIATDRVDSTAQQLLKTLKDFQL
jgi:hypothetical protein